MTDRTPVESACPSCGVVAVRETYDIGSGPELSCANCEWCWGAEGQPLKPVTLHGVQHWMKQQDEPRSSS